ncbi:MAG: hypothetical protein ACO3CU_03670 [Candidatus Nanopelagicales bacterium]
MTYDNDYGTASYYLGRAIDHAVNDDHGSSRACLVKALRVAGEDASSVLAAAQSWAIGLPILAQVIRLNLDKLERIAERQQN